MNDNEIESEIQAKDLNAPRVTPSDVEGEIAGEHYVNVGNAVYPGETAGSDWCSLRLLTICVLVLRNGFTVTGESACASPENFDEVIGRRIARSKALEKVWPLLGFRLRDTLHAQSTAVSESERDTPQG